MNYKHGDARAGHVRRLHKIWRKMLDRCHTGTAERNPRYAGRGITVCPEWHEYVAFREWALGNGYEPLLTIERIDNDGHYAPDNCKWVTQAAQTRNRSTSRKITHEGRTMVLSEWARERGLTPSLIYYRIKRGWPLEKALAPKEKT